MNVGDTARRTRRVTEQDIELFAAMTGDRNPLHFDDNLAERSRFGGIVVQGGVTSGLLNALVVEDLPGPGSVFLHTDLSFRSPVRPGDVLRGGHRSSRHDPDLIDRQAPWAFVRKRPTPDRHDTAAGVG